jgi:hypothetical protein
VEDQKAAEKEQVAPAQPAYEKPTLQRLGLLRLMTRYSVAGERDDDEWERRRED